MMNPEYSFTERVSFSMHRVYGWMACALGITAGVAYYIAQSPAIFTAIFSNPAYFAALVIAQLGLVLAISFLLQRMSFATALTLFVLYAASVGVTMSAVLHVYQETSVYAAFFVTSGMFAAMALYGYFTSADLTSIGSIGIMVLFGMILTGVINLFLRSESVSYVLSLVGVVVFSLLTAYDAQKIKEMARRFMGDRETAQKIALFGALTLYLDFINLFLSLLQVMGKKRND